MSGLDDPCVVEVALGFEELPRVLMSEKNFEIWIEARMFRSDIRYWPRSAVGAELPSLRTSRLCALMPSAGTWRRSKQELRSCARLWRYAARVRSSGPWQGGGGVLVLEHGSFRCYFLPNVLGSLWPKAS